jgi:uncharacterized membrane protein YgaE (UPF0421/DUF939 family)
MRAFGARLKSRFVSTHYFSEALARLRDSAIPITQIVVAVAGAFSIAHFGFGHETPLLTATVTISSLGFARDARPSRVLESATGMLVGIVVSEGILLVAGQGIPQMAVALFFTLVAARLLSPSAVFAVAAGVQSILVLVLTAPPGGPFVRALDGLIGGVVALVVTVLIPRDPRRLARRDAKRLFTIYLSSLDAIVVALKSADEPAAARALDELRVTQPVVDSWATSLETARNIARLSPFVHRHAPQLESQAQMLRGMDLATRNLRVIARRIDHLVRDGVERPELAEVFARITTCVELISQSVEQPELAETAQAGLAGVAGNLHPRTIMGDARKGEATVVDAAVVLMLRPLVVDLLAVAGIDDAKARKMLPEL